MTCAVHIKVVCIETFECELYMFFRELTCSDGNNSIILHCSIRIWIIYLFRLLASKNLPEIIQTKLPESLRGKAKEVKTRGGVDSIERKLHGIPEALQKNNEIILEVH